MADTPAQSSQSRLCMDAVVPFDTSSEPFEFVSSTLKLRQTHVRSEGIRGTRQRRNHRVRVGQEAVSGDLVLNPSVTELDRLWTRILGGTTAAGVTDVAETLPEFQVLIDKVTQISAYEGCRVSRAVFDGTQGQPIQLTLTLEAETETTADNGSMAGGIVTGGSYPVLTLDTDNFFIFSDCTLTLAAAARKFSQFTLTIDNLLDTNRYNNSITRSEIATQGLDVTLEVTAPYTGDNKGLYDQAIAGAAGSLAVSDGTTTYTFAFGNVKAEAEGPDVPNKSEILLPLSMTCYSTAAASAVKVTKS